MTLPESKRIWDDPELKRLMKEYCSLSLYSERAIQLEERINKRYWTLTGSSYAKGKGEMNERRIAK